MKQFLLVFHQEITVNFRNVFCVTSTLLLSWAITSHCKIFSADADVRLARRIRRDTVEKSRDIGAVLDQVFIASEWILISNSDDIYC